jgi:hypothetical protein
MRRAWNFDEKCALAGNLRWKAVTIAGENDPRHEQVRIDPQPDFP